ncbi:MAG: phosphotransferase family protein [Actinobacteria bacterium]|nr:phosphotransferase family protein [Actinomycetota bacterium]MCL5446901.1 phosphotransferase family protein [Actinomycetota bacterium]
MNSLSGDVLDSAKVSSWMEHNVEGTTAPFSFSLIAGGRSNLTFKITDARGNAYALRRPPSSHILPTAHDMAREYRVISALASTLVPVAHPLALCEDVTVTGSPFYVMSFVEGTIIREAADCDGTLGPTDRTLASQSMVDTLVTLHSLDVDAIGLGDLGPRESYIERQLKRWMGQYAASMDTLGKPAGPADPVRRAYDHLRASVPATQRTSLVHGDYRLDNIVLDDNASVKAVLDWEICALGDPLADAGLLLVYWAEKTDESPLVESPATALEGFYSRDELIARYAQRSGLDAGNIEYYMAFGYWKLACILTGVYARYVSGAAGGDRTSVDRYAAIVEWLASLALSLCI